MPQRVDRVTAAVEALNEGMIVAADLRQIDDAKRALGANTTLDPEVKLHHVLTLNVLHERGVERWHKTKKKAPDRSKVVPKPAAHQGDKKPAAAAS